MVYVGINVNLGIFRAEFLDRQSLGREYRVPTSRRRGNTVQEVCVAEERLH